MLKSLPGTTKNKATVCKNTNFYFYAYLLIDSFSLKIINI